MEISKDAFVRPSSASNVDVQMNCCRGRDTDCLTRVASSTSERAKSESGVSPAQTHVLERFIMRRADYITARTDSVTVLTQHFCPVIVPLRNRPAQRRIALAFLRIDIGMVTEFLSRPRVAAN